MLAQYRVEPHTKSTFAHLLNPAPTKILDRTESPVAIPKGCIVMRAMRPLVGKQTFEFEGLGGGFFAVIELDSENEFDACVQMSTNLKLDAAIVLMASAKVQQIMAVIDFSAGENSPLLDKFKGMDVIQRKKATKALIGKLQGRPYAELLNLHYEALKLATGEEGVWI